MRGDPAAHAQEGRLGVSAVRSLGAQRRTCAAGSGLAAGSHSFPGWVRGRALQRPVQDRFPRSDGGCGSSPLTIATILRFFLDLQSFSHYLVAYAVVGHGKVFLEGVSALKVLSGSKTDK